MTVHLILQLTYLFSAFVHFHGVFGMNYVAVGQKFNLTFTDKSKPSGVLWRRNSGSLFPAAVDPSGSGCQGTTTRPSGFEFYCENGGETYIAEITSKGDDDGDTFDALPINGSFDYTSFDNDTTPLYLLTCNQPEQVITSFTLICTTNCTNNPVWKLLYKPESVTIEEEVLEYPVIATSMRCNAYTDLQKDTLNYHINQSHAVLSQFNSSNNKVILIVELSFPGTSTVRRFETNPFYIQPLDSSTPTSSPSTTIDTSSITDHDPCKECVSGLPVLITCAVVMIIGIIIFLIRFMKRKVFSEETWKKVLGVWLFLLIACLILLIIYIVGLEPGCCEKETCNGFAIAEIVVDIIIIIVFIFLLIKLFKDEKDNKGKKDTPDETVGMKKPESKHNQERKSDQEKTEKGFIEQQKQ